MIIDIMALIIAVGAAMFSGLMYRLASKEQKARLRPHLFIDKVTTTIDTNKMMIDLAITNNGMITATDAVISKVVVFKGERQPDLVEVPTKAIIVPQQVLHSGIGIKDEMAREILQNHAEVSIDVTIKYKSGNDNYYYMVLYKWNNKFNSWIIEKSDVN